MENYRVKSLIIFIAFFLAGCFGEDGMLAINSDKPLVIKYDVLKKELVYKENSPFALMFFTKNCGSCKEQIKAINEVLKDRNFDFIAVLGDGRGYEDSKDIALSKNVKVPMVYERDAVDYLSNVVGGILGVPAIYFYDKEGKFSKRFLGLTPKRVIEEEIKKLL